MVLHDEALHDVKALISAQLVLLYAQLALHELNDACLLVLVLTSDALNVLAFHESSLHHDACSFDDDLHDVSQHDVSTNALNPLFSFQEYDVFHTSLVKLLMG